jgi:hypothetical protein
MTADQIRALLEHNSFQWCFIGESSGRLIGDVLCECSAQRALIRDLTARLEKCESAISELRRLPAIIEELKVREGQTEKELDSLHELEPYVLGTRFSPGSPLEGIIAYLTSKYGGNVHDLGRVVVAACDSPHPEWLCRNIVDMRTESGWASSACNETGENPNKWVQYEFKDLEAVFTHYTIRTRCDDGTSHPKSWKIEARAREDQDWIEIDRQNKTTILNGNKKLAVFPVKKLHRCRFVRLTHIGKNHRGDNELMLTALEFFGFLFE